MLFGQMQTCEPLPGCGVVVGVDDCDGGNGNANANPWSYVGEKKGGYAKVETLVWVGEGQGSYGASDEDIRRDACRRCCLCTTVILLVVSLVGIIVYKGVQSHDTPTAYRYPAPAASTGTLAYPAYPAPMPVAYPTPMPVAYPTSYPAPRPVAITPQQTLVRTTTKPLIANCAALPRPFSVTQKIWCCSNQGIACPTLDCNIGFSNWQHGWSSGKQLWCCKHVGRACHDTMGGAAHSQNNSPKVYDCVAGFANWQTTWIREKQVYCCVHYTRGCPSVALAG